MKKVILILAMGLLLSGCTTAQESLGNNFEILEKGLSKGNLRMHSAWTFVKAQSHPWHQCSYKYYPEQEAEILSSPDKSIHLIFESVKTQGTCKDNNGTFHSAHKTFASASNTMKNLVKSAAEKKQEEIIFTINDKKEQCEAIGFTPQTDKFADCVLRLVELDVKSQQQKQIELAISQGNQQVANELKAQRNQQSGEYLMNLSQQLLTPTAPASLPTTRNCSVRGTGVYKRVTCW